MADTINQTCRQCMSHVGFSLSDDGFYYCGCCGARGDDMIDTGMAQEQFFTQYATCTRRRTLDVIHAEPISQFRPTSSAHFDHPISSLADDDDDDMAGFGPSVPSDFGSQRKNISYDDCYTEIRSRYLMGLQVMIQLICKDLVEKFNVSPLIIGLIGPIWLRFLDSTQILSDEWAHNAVHESEAHIEGETQEFQPSGKYSTEPVNIHGKRLVMIWYKSLRERIPICCSLIISFLVCHVAREAILPSDIVRWAIEGKLPYLGAFNEIEKHLGPKSEACTISASRMFRPIQGISTQLLESYAANIAKRIGLELPPVNFHAIASRFCMQLCLSTTEILPMACQICEWHIPPELYLSDNKFRIPTRACVMSAIIVAIRICFNINGYGIWEMSLSDPNSLSGDETTGSGGKFDLTDEMSSEACVGEFGKGLECRRNAVDLIKNLEAKYCELVDGDAFDYSSDLHTYIQYCKDVVFAGLQTSYNDLVEENLMKDFWDFYQNDKKVHTKKVHTATSDDQGVDTSGSRNNKSRKATSSGGEQNIDDHNTCGGPSKNSSISSRKESAIRQIKLEMEENKFCYVSPRRMVKRKDYLHYARRRQEGFIYAVHADYYILLRACAKAAQVDIRVMHTAVLSFERRLSWLEKNIDNSLNLMHDIRNDVCDFCA